MADAFAGCPTLRQSYLDLAVSYDKLADTLGEGRSADRKTAAKIKR